MSWAALRETTRVEDEAYCLLGIFNVHIPLIYGEGTNAFRRLQEEIIRTSHDQSIFAWRQRRVSVINEIHSAWGILAPATSYFKNSGDIIYDERRSRLDRHYTVTNNGLELQTSLGNPLVYSNGSRIAKILEVGQVYRRVYTFGLNCKRWMTEYPMTEMAPNDYAQCPQVKLILVKDTDLSATLLGVSSDNLVYWRSLVGDLGEELQKVPENLKPAKHLYVRLSGLRWIRNSETG